VSGADDILRAELHRLGAVDATPDWDEIVTRAGVNRDRRWRWVTVFTLAVVAIVVGVVTPLGAAIVDELGGFSTWLTGQPGSPVSTREQRAFDAANSRWVGFPAGTKLRRLITRRVDGATVDLIGFRSGSSTLCLRLTAQGKTRTSTLRCVPLAELRHIGAPARVVMIDYAIGKGDKTAWYGIDRVQSANVQITAGVAADEVQSIVLEDDAGRHEVAAASNAFLYVAPQPEVGQQVKRIWARTATGLVRVPFAPAPFGLGSGGSGRAAPPVPRIERNVNGGRIGWLERRELRGQALDVLPPSTRATLFDLRPPTFLSSGRVLAPDPDRPLRLFMSLNARTLCTMWVGPDGASSGGGCMAYPAIFANSLIAAGMTGGASHEFVTFEGVATDDVKRIDVLLTDGQHMRVPLRDNAFLVDAPRARLPAYLVGYDAAGHVISVSERWSDLLPSSAPARGRAKPLLRASGPDDATAELLVGRSTSRGECMYIRFDDGRGGVLIDCSGRRWVGAPLQLSIDAPPPRFVAGRVRPDATVVRIRFADRAHVDLRPTHGYILYAIPRKHLNPARRVVAAEALRRDGSVVGRMSLLFRRPSAWP
jgi:hypothetical protein